MIYLLYGLRKWPSRWKRFWSHITGAEKEFGFAYRGASAAVRGLFWIVELVLRGLELFLVFDLVQILITWRSSVHPLSAYDRSLAAAILGDSRYLDLIQYNDRSLFCKNTSVIAFVSGFVINFWTVISDDVLVHELIHVWQYDRVGIVYVPRALYAQRTEENYNYGGVKTLLQEIKEGKAINQYNYEQQAQIIQDFFLYYQTQVADPLADSLNSPLHQIKQFLHREGLLTSV